MPIDYILEMVEELGRAIRAVIARKKDQPAKALEEINKAFNGTKFGSKEFFRFNFTDNKLNLDTRDTEMLKGNGRIQSF